MYFYKKLFIVISLSGFLSGLIVPSLLAQEPSIYNNGIEYCEVDDDCDDGLYCNGNETCDVGSGPCQAGIATCDVGSGTCQAGSDPCPDDGLYCNGMEGCDEENEVCTHSGNPCTPESCDEANDKCAEGECVELTIGSADGAPGETDVSVEVGLINLNDKVRGVQVDICDEGDYLTCTECEPEDVRAAFFRCSTNELANGCCRVILVADGGILIDEGTGTILTVRYDVKENAPTGCTDLNPENARVSDDIEDPLAVCVSPGKFCFFVCGDIYPEESSPGADDCGDGVTDLFDVLEAIDIVLGIGVHSDCQLTRADLPNGMPPNCREPNGIVDIFDILVIIDVVLDRENCCDDYYGPTKCTTDADCNDGLYCNGEEMCDIGSGICQDGINPCPPPLVCDEDDDRCKEVPPEICNDGEDNDGDGLIDCEDPDCDGFACDDGLYCTEGEICVEGVCAGEERDCDDGLYCTGTEICNENFNLCISTGDPCLLPLVCNEETETCDEIGEGACSDGEDNDGDGLIDCEDPGCDGFACDDGLYCTEGEICVEGVCAGEERDCDDGLYCTGIESCDEGNDECLSSGDPCQPGYLCNEGTDTCDMIPPEICDDGEDNDGDGLIDCEDPDCDGFACDDGLYCTEGEICVEGVCAGEDRDCDDGLYCTGTEICNEDFNLCISSGDPCLPLVCNEETETCDEIGESCDDGEDNDGDGLIDCEDPDCDGFACDDGLYCTEGEICVEGVCAGEDRDCDDGLYCTGTEICNEDFNLCISSGGDPCGDSNECTDDMCYEVDDLCSNVCNASASDDPCCEDPVCADAPQCMSSIITIDPGDAWIPAGVVKVPLCLSNLEDPVGGVQLDLCESNDDCLECVECELTERTTIFDCVVNELDNGCCRVIIFSKNPGGVINPGECNIATLVYILDPACSLTECETLTATNIVVTDQNGFEMEAVGLTGSVCPFTCGDIEPGESAPGANDCGDGDVDIFDIMEEVTFALGEKTPDACQAERADVPTGTPPFCLAPDEGINVLDIMVIIDMALDRPDCCSYYYLGEFF